MQCLRITYPCEENSPKEILAIMENPHSEKTWNTKNLVLKRKAAVRAQKNRPIHIPDTERTALLYLSSQLGQKR